MSDDSIGPKTLSDRSAFAYYWLLNKLRSTPQQADVAEKLTDARRAEEQAERPELNRLDVRATGACTIVIPGVGSPCQDGITEQKCKDIAYQYKDYGAVPYFLPGGHCAK